MTKRLISAAIASAALLASSLAWSIPIGTVGSIDTLLTSANLGNSSEAVETAWVTQFLGGGTVTFEEKTECDTLCNWDQVTDTAYSDVYALGLTSSPAYYLIKTGAGSSTGSTHFLFQNDGSLDYAVLRMSQLGFTSKVTISKVSHITEFTHSVPEPASLGLLGLGLLGVGAARRRAAAR